MIHGDLILSILQSATEPLTMREIETDPRAIEAKLVREDTTFVLRALIDAGTVRVFSPGQHYNAAGACRLWWSYRLTAQAKLDAQNGQFEMQSIQEAIPA